MKTARLQILMNATLACALAFTTASAWAQVTPGYNNKIPEQIMTPDSVETRIGTLKFFDGSPTKETTQKVYDNLDFLRGVETFLKFIPATSIEALRRGMVEMGATTAIRPHPQQGSRQVFVSRSLLLSHKPD